MQVRTFTLLVAGALLAAGVFLFVSSVNATTEGGATVACGSVIHPDTQRAATDDMKERLGLYGTPSGYYDGYTVRCAEARNTRATWSYVLGGAAVVLGAGAALVRIRESQA